MNLRERLKVRALVNFIISIIERLVNIAIKASPKKETPFVPNRKKPLKRIVDNIIPWRK